MLKVFAGTINTNKHEGMYVTIPDAKLLNLILTKVHMQKMLNSANGGPGATNLVVNQKAYAELKRLFNVYPTIKSHLSNLDIQLKHVDNDKFFLDVQ